MQTVISQIAFTFVDDAVALATGSVKLVRPLTVDALTAIRVKLTAPLERLALTCDVAGILPTRRSTTVPCRRTRGRFDVFGIVSTFRTLRDLT